MTPARKKKLAAVAAGGLALWLIAMRRSPGKGTVLIGPVTVKDQLFDIRLASEGKVNDADVQRVTLALLHSRQLMGADPNTLASRRPTPSEQTYIEQTLAALRVMSQMTNGAVPYPTAEEQRLVLAKKLPGDTLQKSNAVFYSLLGIDPNGDNAPTVPLTAANEASARSAIALWRPYSQSAVDTLFVHLDEARELGGIG